MPVVILVDNSLSMYQNVYQDKTSKISKKDISHLIVNKLIEKISKIDPYDYISLVSVSSQAKVLFPFTRDHSKIKDTLTNIKPGDSFNLESGLNKSSQMVIDTWGCFTNVQIVLITDELDNSYQENSIKKMYTNLKENKTVLKELYEQIGYDYDKDDFFKNSILNDDLLNSNVNFDFGKKFTNMILPFPFPNRFDIICLKRVGLSDRTNTIRYGFDEDNFRVRMIQTHEANNGKIFYLKEILKLNNSIGKVHCIDNFDTSYIENTFMPGVLNDLFEPFDFELKCGCLKSMVNLVPSPITKGNQNYGYIGKELSGSIEIVGFLSIADFVTPQTISRHLINDKNGSSFVTLLQTSLKSESMAAIVKLSVDWYGAIISTDKKLDVKKKTYLNIAIFKPDFSTIESILSKVTPLELKPVKTPLIQRPQAAKSYAKGCIVWYRAVNLQSDVQKIFRNAKKMQEKMPIFYKELNRVRKAALTFGFYELFQGLSKMFERELINSASSYNADATAQLGHVIRCLNSPEYKEYQRDIQPWISQAPKSKK